MDSRTRIIVRARAIDQCEYCRLPQEHSAFRHHVEHIQVRQHEGSDSTDNLALACHRCNLAKGPNLTAIDTATAAIVQLFHPRRDIWDEHFKFVGARIEGLTPTGRATVRLLAMNDPRRCELRSAILARANRRPN